MKHKDFANNIFNTIISLTPALVQVFAFFAVDFSDRLKLNSLLLNHENLNLVNIIVLFFSIITIAIYSYWKSNFFMIRTNSNPTQPAPYVAPEKIAYGFLKNLIKLFFASLLVFIFIISSKNIIQPNIMNFAIFCQWLSYGAMLTSTTFIIFIWLEDIRKKETYQSQRENYYSLVIEKLRELGWLETAKIISISQEPGPRIIVIKVGTRILQVQTSYDGVEIFGVTEVTG